MACPNFKNGPKHSLGPLGVKERSFEKLHILMFETITRIYGNTKSLYPRNVFKFIHHPKYGCHNH
jgi:hypothetical protein